MKDLVLAEGWQIFKRWAVKYKSNCLKKSLVPVLVSYSDVASNPDFTDNPYEKELSFAEVEKRARQQIEFMRGYVLALSLERKNFAPRVATILKRHNNKDWSAAYSVLLMQSDQEGDWTLDATSYNFVGIEANMFCGELQDIDFASAMAVLPFNRILIRNRNGDKWSRSGAEQAICSVNTDLNFDGLDLDFQKDFLMSEFLGLYRSNA